jgi:hypothetical protein
VAVPVLEVARVAVAEAVVVAVAEAVEVEVADSNGICGEEKINSSVLSNN